jgi:plastocyanin
MLATKGERTVLIPTPRTRARSLRRATTIVGAVALALLSWWSQASPVQAEDIKSAIVEPSDDPDSWVYTPPTLTVHVGDAVAWRNDGQEVHTVTSDDGSFDSGDLQHGATWSHTFTAPGTYTYFCVPHTWMAGTIIVEG